MRLDKHFTAVLQKSPKQAGDSVSVRLEERLDR